MRRGPGRRCWAGLLRLPAPNETAQKVASFTIRSNDEAAIRQLRLRAAEHGRTEEEEAREIIRTAVEEPFAPAELAASIRARVAMLGGIKLTLPAHEEMREPPTL